MQDIKVYKGVAKYTEQFSPSKDPIITLKNTKDYSSVTLLSREYPGYPKENLYDGVLSDQLYLGVSSLDFAEITFSQLYPELSGTGGLKVVSTVSFYLTADAGGRVILYFSDRPSITEDFDDTTTSGPNTRHDIGVGEATLIRMDIQAGRGVYANGGTYFNVSGIQIDSLMLVDSIQVTSSYRDNNPTLALPLWNKDGSDKLTIEDVSADPQTVSRWGEVSLPSWVSTGGKWYNGYAFFSEDALEISKGGQVTDFNFGFGDFTIESWVYFTDENRFEDIFSTGPYNMNQFTLRRVESDQLEASWNDQIILSGGLFEANQWYHIAAVSYTHLTLPTILLV